MSSVDVHDNDDSWADDLPLLPEYEPTLVDLRVDESLALDQEYVIETDDPVSSTTGGGMTFSFNTTGTATTLTYAGITRSTTIPFGRRLTW